MDESMCEDDGEIIGGYSLEGLRELLRYGRKCCGSWSDYSGSIPHENKATTILKLLAKHEEQDNG